jgi:hypothetical protein
VNRGRWFHLTVPEQRVRQMTRAEYYAMRHWLRSTERVMAARMSAVEREYPEVFADLMAYGSATVPRRR